MSDYIYAGPWLGALTDSGVSLRAAVHRGADAVELLVAASDDPDFAAPTVFPAELVGLDGSGYLYRVVSARAAGLAAHTAYRTALRVNGELQSDRAGAFRTLPAPGSETSFRFGLGGCSGNASFLNFGYPHPEAFEALAREPDLLFFCHLGDLHYGNIEHADVVARVEAYTWFFEQRHHGLLFSSLPLACVWDDHDFLGNDSAGGDEEHHAAARTAVEAYDLMLPHYPFVDPAHGVAQGFTVGRVRFLLLDLRFNRTTRPSADGGPRQVLGSVQRAWLEGELRRASEYDLVVLVASFPWLGTHRRHHVSDSWFAFPEEREGIASFIAREGIRNLCMLSADAHMLAIDDGSHNTFAGGARGFPIFHAAALDSRPSQKGGLYAIGTERGEPGEGVADKRQYGVCEVTYDGDPAGPLITWIGKRAEKDGGGATREIMRFAFRASQAVTS
jgi:phosphodiesterase/alkaline phosphatase D-like protein